MGSDEDYGEHERLPADLIDSINDDLEVKSVDRKRKAKVQNYGRLIRGAALMGISFGSDKSSDLSTGSENSSLPRSSKSSAKKCTQADLRDLTTNMNELL